MKRLEEAKRKYEETPIPEELSDRVMRQIRKAEQPRRTVKSGYFWKVGMTAAAALAAAFITAVNTSEAFASSVGKIPVIGEIARVLTFRSYETETDELKISVDIPSIDMISEDFSDLEESANEEIHKLCQDYADEATKRAKSYRQAFLDTGGTQEEWEAHNIEIKVWYEVKTQTEDYLSLEIIGTESWSSANTETQYFNFNLKEGKTVVLEDLLGADYAQTAEESIRAQMQEREADSGEVFWEDEFKGVDENTKFYVNEAGNPVIVFDRYEIAPGAYGQPEFEIPVSGMEETEETTAEDASETIPEETWTESAGFEDNFSVDQEAAAEFGRQIKEAAATRDLEALADLAAYPLYVGFAEGGESVESKEEFLALGADRIFTGALTESVAAADENSLTPSMAGFVLSGESGAPNIIFGVRDGKLAISGINY